MTRGSRLQRRGRARVAGTRVVRTALAGALGVAAALLVACSGSGGNLIPAASAGPLRGDFEVVARAAENGNGKCSETEAALTKTELDFAALPTSVDTKLRNTLSQGIANLKVRPLALCAQPLPQATNTAPTTTQTAPTTKTQTTPATTPTTPTTPTTTPTTTTPEGGTPPEESKGAGAEPGGEEPPGKGGGGGKGNGGLEAGK